MVKLRNTPVLSYKEPWMQENGLIKFRTIVYEVSFFVVNPVAARFRLTYNMPWFKYAIIANSEKATIRKMPLCAVILFGKVIFWENIFKNFYKYI